MTDIARERILRRLRHALAGSAAPKSGAEPLSEVRWSSQEKIQRLRALMEAVRTEVHVVPSSGWTDALRNILIPRKLQTLLFAPGTEYGQALARSWEQYQDTLPTLKPYSGDIESFKEDLFMADAAITGCRGAIAQTGALILVPSEEEPRLMSLVPHIHIALLAADTVYATLAEAIAGQAWSSGMPTNTLLISGPSKTADIEFTLAFGVHGPKELILLILDDREAHHTEVPPISQG